MKEPIVKKKENVEEAYRRLCNENEVMIDGRCVDIRINLKEKTVIYQELPKCRLKLPDVDPIEEKAKQKVFRDIYRDPRGKLIYREIVNPPENEDKEVNE